MNKDFSIKKKYISSVFFNIIIPLLTGLIIYLIFNKNTYISDLIEIPYEINLKGAFGKFIKCWACDFLWSYAFTFSLFYALTPFRYKVLLSAIISFCVGVILEFFQYCGIITGTFDVLDIIFELAAVLIAVGMLKGEKI